MAPPGMAPPRPPGMLPPPMQMRPQMQMPPGMAPTRPPGMLPPPMQMPPPPQGMPPLGMPPLGMPPQGMPPLGMQTSRLPPPTISSPFMVRAISLMMGVFQPQLTSKLHMVFNFDKQKMTCLLCGASFC